jgi:predicted short-subunit dehydrogenase-like oxidoreductase (DUF2520 family)
MLRIGFIGAGTIGSALALVLDGKGYSVVSVASRRRSSAVNLAEAIDGCSAADSGQLVADYAEMVFITTPDDAIASVASSVDWHRGQMVIHCSGADTSALLDPAREAGAYVGVFHPLQTFASIREARENLPGSTFAIEAEEPLLEILKTMAVSLGGRWLVLAAGDKVIYHASAVMACNYFVTLVKLATDLWQTFGVSREQAVEALLPLIKGTVHNIETLGIPGSLTGPIARGDVGTINKHLVALKKTAPGLLATYRALGLETIPVALAKGRIDEKQVERLKEILGEEQP